ncbi:YkvS family protein [Halobacillus rhizosphaerae]|uniref:YkvS family protein n=1 Tax=Halobacillus rhizosphaerae TaxID=3064889 RepID=UPI00398A8785
MIQPDDRIANPGQIVSFERDDMVFRGKVIPSQCQRSVIVDLTIMENLEDIDFEFERTVVAHTNYRIEEE